MKDVSSASSSHVQKVHMQHFLDHRSVDESHSTKMSCCHCNRRVLTMLSGQNWLDMLGQQSPAVWDNGSTIQDCDIENGVFGGLTTCYFDNGENGCLP